MWDKVGRIEEEMKMANGVMEGDLLGQVWCCGGEYAVGARTDADAPDWCRAKEIRVISLAGPMGEYFAAKVSWADPEKMETVIPLHHAESLDLLPMEG